MRSRAGLLSLLIVGASVASAQITSPIAPPPGLAPGSTYHVTFTTSTEHGITPDLSVPAGQYPAFGGVDAADWVVTFGASNAGLFFGWDFASPVYRAIISNDESNAIDRVGITGPVYNLQGALVASSEADFFDGQLNVPLNIDELGNEITEGPRMCGRARAVTALVLLSAATTGTTTLALARAG